ncbi:MAG: nicotinate-nucleotide adenylyltransferase [Rhodospirillales bacterium]
MRSPYFIAGVKQRIGLMGGSFNPAHDGHLHISRQALQRIRLDEIWWLVSPQNPLKPAHGMASFEDRFASAEAAAAQNPRIRVTDAEARLGAVHTADTLGMLQARFPALRFVWMMGADNLGQIGRWRRWAHIFNSAPVAVFARPPYSRFALSSPAAARFAGARVHPALARSLADMPPPAWAFFHTPANPQSATRIRGHAQT